MAITGCGGEKPNSEKQTPESPKITAKLGSAQPVEGPYTAALNDFAKLVSKKTNGNLTIQVFPAQQLGSARELIENTQKGALEAVQVAAANFTPFHAPAAIPGLPFIFPNADVMQKVLINGQSGQALLDSLSKAGLKGAAFWPAGFNVFTANKAINTVQDLKGKKMRVLENPILMAQYKAFGSNPVPINYAELYNSLQQGVVDGQENPLGGVYDSKLYEVQKYLTLSEHTLFTLLVAFNQAWYDKLPQEYQEILISSAREAGEKLYRNITDMEINTMLPTIEKAGVNVIKLSPDEKKAFREKAGPASEEALRKMLDEEGLKLLNLVKEEVKQNS